MIIYRSLHKSPNKILQIIRPITINNENSQKRSLCYDFDFSKKMRTSREGSKNSDTCGQGEEGGGK